MTSKCLSRNKVYMLSEAFDHEGELEWVIKDHSKLSKEQFIISKEFSIASSCQIKWEVMLVFKYPVENTRVFIRRTDKVEKRVEAEVRYSMENSKLDLYAEHFVRTTFDFYDEHYTSAFERISKNSDDEDVPSSPTTPTLSSQCLLSKNLLSKDILIVRCQIKIEGCCSKTGLVKGEFYDGLRRHPLSSDFLQAFEVLYTEMPLADVVLNSGGTSMAAHRAILCARSPVMRRMLETDMKEKKNGVIEVEDIQPAILKEFLKFLYTDMIGDISLDQVCDLYAIADRYQVECLRDRCGLVLAENLNKKTVCKVLQLADLHNDASLKEKASNYISGNFARVKDTDEFRCLVDVDPRLVLHIVMFRNTNQSSKT